MPKKAVGRDRHHLKDRTRFATRSVAGIMQGGGWIQQLRAHDDEREQWRNRLRAALPAELAAAVVAAQLKGGVLTVQAASAGWASRLRFALPTLAARLQEQAPGVVTIRVRVAPASPPRSGGGR